MAESTNMQESENLNTKNGNFICGVVEGKVSTALTKLTVLELSKFSFLH